MRFLFNVVLAAIAFMPHPAAGASPYRLVATTPLPAMPEGDFDQLAADVPHHRLYVSAEDGGTIYVFDLGTGALIRSGGAVASPHKVALDARRGHLFVADGNDGSVKILDRSLGLVARVPVGPKADTGVFDPARRIFYVGSRDPKASETSSIISAISADTLKVVAIYTMPANTLKGLILDRPGNRLLVSLRERNAIGVVHLDTAKTEIWTPTGLHKNVPLALDPAHGALYAGSREPGRLEILDAADGHLKASLPSTETSDSVSLDPEHDLLYLSGNTGMSRYRIHADGSVNLLETDPALVGKTSLYVSQLRRIYVMRPRKGQSVAELNIFEVGLN